MQDNQKVNTQSFTQPQSDLIAIQQSNGDHMSENSLHENESIVNSNFDDVDIDFLAEATEVLLTPDQAKIVKDQDDLSKFLLTAGAHDEGNAQCVHYMYKGKFAYNDANGWMAYDGKKWTRDGAEAILDRCIIKMFEARLRAVINSKQMDRYGHIIKKSVPNSSAISGVKALLTSLSYTSVNEFDNEPDKLNCLNGVVDLRTGKITPHSSEQKFTHCTSVGYYPNADQSFWKRWLVDTVGQDSADYLKKASGYSATGHTREELLVYMFGPSRSGKGTFTETMIELYGKPLATEVNFSTFTAQRTGDSQNFDLAPLKACRFIAASESNTYERFNEAKVKALTGGNEIYCALKHKTHFGYKPQFKIWLSSNQPVNADPDDDAVWGRIRVVEFPYSKLGKEDKELKQKMQSREVLEGVLAWVVEGAMEWYTLGSAGLPELESGRVTKNKQRSELDNIQAWISEYCVVKSGLFVANSMLYLSYKKWCEDNGVEPKKQKGLSQSLIKKGFVSEAKKLDGKTVRGFSGLGLAF